MPAGSLQAPRRTRAKGAPGIYWRQTPHGRRYEFVYVDSDARQRWQVVPGYDDLEAAKAQRAEIIAKLGRGEKVRKTHETLGEYAEKWLARQNGRIRPRTLDWYTIAIRQHIKPALGNRRLQAIRVDDVADLIAAMRANGKSAATQRSVLTPLGRIMGAAVRSGLIPTNPVRGLEKDERPKGTSRAMRILASDEIPKLIAACPKRYRLLVEMSIATGVRQGEALGLIWANVDLDHGRLHVDKQLGRDRLRIEPKTPNAKRTLSLPPTLVRKLREHKEAAFAIGQAKGDDFVFRSETGGPLHHRNVVRRGLDKAIKDANLDNDGKPSLRWHDLRHTFASMLIGEGLDVVYVSSRLGHASPSTTLTVYSHLMARAQQGQAGDRRAGSGNRWKAVGKRRGRTAANRPSRQPRQCPSPPRISDRRRLAANTFTRGVPGSILGAPHFRFAGRSMSRAPSQVGSDAPWQVFLAVAPVRLPKSARLSPPTASGR